MTTQKHTRRVLIEEVALSTKGNPQQTLGTATGKTLDEPELTEVLIDGCVGTVWVPTYKVQGQGYDLHIPYSVEDAISPQDAALSLLSWLRHPEVAGVTMHVTSVDDRTVYTVDVEVDDAGEMVARLAGGVGPDGRPISPVKYPTHPATFDVTGMES